MTAQWLRLCAEQELLEGDSLRVAFDGDTHAHGLCLLRHNGQVHAYLNRCPHQDMAMDWLPGRFLDPEGEHIVCAMHGAQFQADDGLCVAGPCLGLRLTAVPVTIRHGDIMVHRQHLAAYCD
ncbi:MAG: Rieske (2Fe-2S) protein [Oceanococcus sp.]